MDADLSALRTVAECGCTRAVVQRTVPAFDPETGAPLLDPDGNILTVESDDLQDIYCADHSAQLKERQDAAQRAITSGDMATALRLMTGGATPFAQLEAADPEPTDGDAAAPPVPEEDPS